MIVDTGLLLLIGLGWLCLSVSVLCVLLWRHQVSREPRAHAWEVVDLAASQEDQPVVRRRVIREAPEIMDEPGMDNPGLQMPEMWELAWPEPRPEPERLPDEPER